MLLYALFACANSPMDTSDSGGGADSADTADGGSALDPVCTDPVDPPCVDEIIQELSLHDDKTSSGEVTTTLEGEDFVTLVDASAGGMNNADNRAWTYVRFTPEGATRVDIDDETALEDMSWHLALRRFILRLNSGDSGPSCVGVAEQKKAAYEDLTAADVEGASYTLENFYDDECQLDTDKIGGPLTAMEDWWSYTSCVETTSIPFLMQLDDGHVLKIVVEAYYEGSGQDECNTGGSTDAEGGYIQLRWRMLI